MGRGNGGAWEGFAGLDSPFAREAFEAGESEGAPLGASSLSSPFERAFEVAGDESETFWERETAEELQTKLQHLALLPNSVEIDGIEAPLKPVNIIPGIYDGPSKFKIAPRLQACLEAVMKKRFPNLSVALVDLTKGDSPPEFAGFNHKSQVPVSGIPKMAAMLAAYQLRHDLRTLLKTTAKASKSLDELFSAARAEWAATQTLFTAGQPFAGPITQRGKVVFVNGNRVPLINPKAPQLENIFQPVSAGGPLAVEFTNTGEKDQQVRDAVDAFSRDTEPDRRKTGQKLRDLGFEQRLRIMMGSFYGPASDLAAATIVGDLGYLYIASTLLQYGLYDPNRGGGLWLGSDYDRGEWQGALASKLTLAKGSARSATAGSLAAFLTLLKRNQLVDRQSSGEMQKLIEQEFLRDRPFSGFKEGIEQLPAAGSDLPIILSKGGVGDGGMDDCAYIERPAGTDRTLSYVAVGLRSKKSGELRALIQELDKCILANNSPAASGGGRPQPEAGEEAELEDSPFAHAFTEEEPETEEQLGQFGTGTRSQVTKTQEMPFRWICSIAATRRIKTAATERHTGLAPAGTGFLISPCHVLTAAHVLKSVTKDDQGSVTEEHEAETVVVTPGRDEDNAPFGTFDAKSWVLHPRWDPKKGDNKTDYAVITLDRRAGDQKFDSLKGQPLGFWKLDALPSSVAAALIGARVVTAGYPESKKKQMWCFTGKASTGSADLDASLTKSRQVEEWVRKNAEYRVTADADLGQSGSPVWVVDQGKRHVIGILVEAGKKFNVVTALNDDVLRQLRKWTGADTPAQELEEEPEPEMPLEESELEPEVESGGGSEIEAPYPGQSELLESFQEYEDPPPKGLVLLDHMHIPKTADSKVAGGFRAGSLAVMKPSAMNPGFIDSSDEFITDSTSSGLQTCLQKLIPGQFSNLLAAKTSTKPAAGDRVRIALVDLTGAKLAKPDFAGWGSTSARYGASAPKILALYAAFQLRRDLRHMAEDQKITTGDALKTFALSTWKAKKLWRGFPNLSWLFRLKDWSGKADELNFSEDVRAVFGKINHNDTASLLIRGVGFPYIASVAWQSGLRHPARGGLWLSHAYDGGDAWGDNPAMRAPDFSHTITALSAATYFTLMAQGRLVDDASSAEIKTVLAGGCHTCLFPSEIPLEATKCGIFKPFMHDCILVRHSGIAYAAAILTEIRSGWPRPTKCPTGDEADLYKELCRAVDALIVQNNKSPKPPCG